MSYIPQVNQPTEAEQSTPLAMPVGSRPVSTEEPLVLDTGGESNQNLSPETVDARTTKFKYGLGDLLGKTRDEIYQDLQNGNEDQLRAQAASTIDQRKRIATQDLLAKTAANKGAPLTDEEKAGLAQIVLNMDKDTDPATVMESAYGKQFMATLDRVAQGNPDNVYTDVQQKAPETVATLTNDHTDLMTKHQIVQTMLEDVQDQIKNQSYIGYGWDIAKGMIPGYHDYELRGLAPGVGQFTGIGLGENLEEQRKSLWRLPQDDFYSTLKGIIDPLRQGNPQLAQDYLTAMKGQASDDKFINDWSLAVDIAGTGIGGKTAKAVTKVIKGSEDLAKVGELKTAVTDITKASLNPNASKSTIEAAAGDLNESAITRATTNAVADANNVPQATKRGIEALTSTHRLDMQDVKANPGQYGQDIVNRIEERGNTMFANLMETAVNIQKNEGLPDVLSNETTVRAIVEDMKEKYRDLKNSIVDTSPIYREPLSNTYLIDFNIGNPDGTYFTQKSVAENARQFLGLADATVEDATNPAFTKANVQEAKYTKNISDAQKIIDRERAKMSATGVSDEQKAKSAEQIATAEEYIVDQATSRIEARRQASKVEQQGLGFYIKVTKPIDQTRPVIRDALAKTTNTKIPDSPVATFLNSWIGKYRTPEEVLSPAERANRLTTTYAPSSYFNIMVDNAKDIKSLQAGRFSGSSKKKRWEEWQRGLENAQELPDELDPDRKGYFFKSPGEMESYWQQWFHRLPDEQEIGAYFEFKRGMEMDRVMRNIAEHRNMQRLGNETHNIILRDVNGKEVRSPDFDGKLLQKIPGATDNIAVFDTELGKERVVGLAKQSVKTKEEWQKDIDRGYYKLVELYNPKLRPLSGYSTLTDERVRYVLVPQLETRSLDWNHVPRRGGGHIQYDYDFYLKQPKIRSDEISGSHWYEGDTTIMAAPTQGIGRRVADHLNEVRRLLADRNEDAAREYSNKNLHVNWDKVKNWFVGYKDENGKYQVPRLDLKHDIEVVPKNRRTIDINDSVRKRYSDFRDESKEGSMASQNRVEYTEERDAYELDGVNVEGTKANPLYKVAPADKIDPITTMNRGFARISRSSFMDDYKTMAVEHWLAQAIPYLDAKTRNEVYSAPFWWFNEGKFLKSAPPEIQAQLEAAKYHIQQFAGQPSLTDTLLHSAAQKLADISFEKFGPKGLVLTPTWLLPKLRDPFGFARSIAFDLKLGLFNIPQFIVQSANYSNILGIAGHKYATPGTLAAQLHFWSRVNSNPAILNHLDGIASKMYIPGASRWKPGEFKEALEELNKTGFATVGGEYAALDNPMAGKLITTKAGQFLDWGRSPFKAGEQNARYGAWYTAFKEFRDANPLGRITNEQRAQILQRADLLNINMSRASGSALHKGILSIPTQFYTYQLRLAELMFGGRLTAKERARLFITNAALYGVPMATGMTGIPAADWIREKALDNGYVVGDDYLKSMFMEGIPSAIGAMVTGKGDPQAGTWYDIGPRFGTKGFEFLGTATGTDKGWLDALGGPVYSIAKDTIASSDGLAHAVISMMRRDGEVFPLVPEDVADVAREISSFNAAWRVYAATQYGRWVSKTDAYLSDTTTAQAVFGALAGTKDVNINDINIKSNSLKRQADYEKEVENRFRQEFRRGVLAQNDNPELAKRFFTRAAAWLEIGGYREDRISSLMSKALQDNQSVLDKVNWDYYIRKAPDAQADTRYHAQQKTLQLQEKRQ